MNTLDESVFDDTELTSTAIASVSSWPLFVVWGLATAAAAVAILNDHILSIIAYAVLLVAGIVLLVVYRMSVVRASMSASGAAVGVQTFERIAVLAIVLGCLANGIVIGLWVGGWELWA